MITENLSTLKIHKLTQEQYDRELEAGRVDPSALYLTPDNNTNIFRIELDNIDSLCSHSASEIIKAIESDMTIIVNYDPHFTIERYSYNEYVEFLYQYIHDDGEIFSSYVTVYEDKTVEFYENSTHAVNVVTVDNDNIASMNSDDIDNITWYDGIVVLYYQGYYYNFQYFDYQSDTDKLYAYFICEQSDGNSKFTSVVTVDENANVSVVSEAIQPIVPIPEESDVGKVLVAGSDNQVYWENASGKTLTEHLAEEDMILSSRQYGNELPPAGIPGRIFFKRVSE